MRLITIWLFMVLSSVCLSCAPSSESQSQPVSDKATPPPAGYVDVYCHERPECILTCVELYPYQDPQEITREYSRRGLLYSGLYYKALEENEELRLKQEDCKSKVIDFRPM